MPITESTKRNRRALLPTVVGLLALLASLPTRLASAADEAAGSGSVVELRGFHRARYERLAPQYRAGLGGSDTVLGLQTSLALEANWYRLSVVGEILDARGELNDSDSVFAGVVNTLEPIQTYVTWKIGGSSPDDGSQSSLRFGRLTMDLGKRRLLARSSFRSAVASFTGADWQWQSSRGTRVRAFVVVPMRTLPNEADALLDNDAELDRGARETLLSGAYYLSAPGTNLRQVELSFLKLDSANGAGEIPAVDIDTLSVRVFRPVARSGLNYEIEAGIQRGESAASQGSSLPWLQHDAYYAHAEIGYALDVAWTPNILLQYDRASGDRDPTDDRNERFNPLFGERRFDTGPTSIYGAFQRSNIASPGVRVTFNPAPRWRGMVAYRSFQLDAARDAWVGSGWRDTTGQAGRSLGRQVEASFNWSVLPNRLTIETGFAHTHVGRFVRQTAGATFRGSPDYFYAALTTTF
jgi:hypothetical protein